MGLCLLIDGNNLVFRGFYALDGKNLKTSSGRPTGALFAFTRMLVKLLKDRKPDFVAAAFDVSRETFRKRIYPAYKANRRPTPPELLAQIPLAQKAVEALGIKLLTDPEVEADDLIGTLAEQCKKSHDVLILSGDRDLLQLIDDRVRVELCIKGTSETRILGRLEFEQAYGFPPIGIIDLKALQGDASDNIPGVPGIGEKKGLALVRDFGSVDSLYSGLDKIENPKLRQMVEAGRESAMLSRELATIKRDVEKMPEVSDLAWSPDSLQKEMFFGFLREWELFSLLKELGAVASRAKAPALPSSGTVREPSLPAISWAGELPGNPESARLTPSGKNQSTEGLKPVPGERLLISSLQDLTQFLTSLKQEVAIDVETDGLNPFQNKIIGVSLADSIVRAAYIPLRHSYLGLDPSDQIPPEQAFEVLRKGLAGKTLVGHNLKFDLAFLNAEGFPIPENFFDTMLAVYVLNPTMPNGLKDLSRELLRFSVQTFQEVTGGKPFAHVSIADAGQYGCQDVLLPMHLLPYLRGRLAEENLVALLSDLEEPLLPLLLEMETLGIGLNRAYLRDLTRDFAADMKSFEASIHKHAGVEFNVNSGKQLQEILFVKLGLTPPKKTKTGFSTDSDVLKELAPLHPICRDLLSYREIAKLKTTYADSLETLVEPKSGVIHTNFNQMVTATGRLSSNNPNLQNIPIKTELGRRVRRAFVPPREGDVLISLDYSQIELRLLAHLSEDPDLVDAFKRNLDVHSITAAKLFGKPVEQVTSAERKVGKTVNFGIIYGISAHGLAEGLGVSRPQAKSYIDGFFATFPSVQEFFARNQREAQALRKVTTLFGRVRPLLDLQSKDFQARSFEERVARNTPLQGSAADLVKKAMLDADRYLKKEGKKTRLILQIHDELIFSMPQDEIAEVSPRLKALMEQVFPLKVPLVCDMARGANLADLQDVG